MGLNLDEFYRLSPNEFYEALSSHNEERNEKIKSEMEIMRLQTFFLVNLELDPKSRMDDVKDLMKFKWEEEPYDESKVIVPNWEELDKKFKGVR